jgi:predicted transposase/invertase (TIGR01784 family)
VPNPHDAFFRHCFARVAVAVEFFRLYLPRQVVTRLDLSRVKLEEGAFVDKKLREHFTDLLFRVGLKGGGEAFIFILLEHKSAPDERVALQVLRYMVQAWDRLPMPLPLIIRSWSITACAGGASPSGSAACSRR